MTDKSLRRNRNTKIVATLGPASSTAADIRRLYLAGADVFRLNFSHGSHNDHQERFLAIRALEHEIGRPIPILLDLQGPKLRVGSFVNGKVVLAEGQKYRFDLGSELGDNERAPLPHPEIFAAVQPGDDLLVDDGRIRLRITECGAGFANVISLNAGVISDRKGVNVPNAVLAMSPLTEKDKRDLAFGLALGVDWIALSFVQRRQDVEELKSLVGTRASIMAKLEKPAAIEALEEIVDAADGIMVARGDLGVELPPEVVPGLQKRIVNACRKAGKPVIVATQMLESMVAAPTPTRAEASDVATAVYDGVDAVMLSAESASGAYPIQAVEMMDRIISSAERDVLPSGLTAYASTSPGRSSTDAICAAIHTMVQVLPVAATVAYTTTGATTLRVAHARPKTPILSLTPNIGIARKLALVWGVHSVCTTDAENVEDMVSKAETVAAQEGFCLHGKPLLVVAGTPFGVSGSTNLLRIVWPTESAEQIDDQAQGPNVEHISGVCG